MSFMDQALDIYEPPTAEDLDIALPSWRGQKKEEKDAEAGEPRDLGQHGGAADAHSDVVATAAAEPEPQRDDPDDGEHTDSTEQEVAARLQRAAAAADEEEQQNQQPEEPAEEPVEPAELPEAEDEDEQAIAAEPKAAQKPLNVKQQLAQIKGSEPRTVQKTGFSTGDVETLTVTRFPQALVDRLRLSLAPSVGGEFAEALSSGALITAFLIAKTGVELDVDANTRVAVDVFRQVDPRLLAVENKLDEVMSDVSQLANAMKLSLNRVSETANVVDGMEFSVAYLIADRVAGLTTTDIDETNVDVAQKKVLTARENIRKRAKAQRTIEKQRDGRRM